MHVRRFQSPRACEHFLAVSAPRLLKEPYPLALLTRAVNPGASLDTSLIFRAVVTVTGAFTRGHHESGNAFASRGCRIRRNVLGKKASG